MYSILSHCYISVETEGKTSCECIDSTLSSSMITAIEKYFQISQLNITAHFAVTQIMLLVKIGKLQLITMYIYVYDLPLNVNRAQFRFISS